MQDLAGQMFGRLIADRKFLATFYTLPSSAAMLAELAVAKLDGHDRLGKPRRGNSSESGGHGMWYRRSAGGCAPADRWHGCAAPAWMTQPCTPEMIEDVADRCGYHARCRASHHHDAVGCASGGRFRQMRGACAAFRPDSDASRAEWLSVHWT